MAFGDLGLFGLLSVEAWSAGFEIRGYREPCASFGSEGEIFVHVHDHDYEVCELRKVLIPLQGSNRGGQVLGIEKGEKRLVQRYRL